MLDTYTVHMRYAVELALKARWKTVPNPCVGAVILHNGEKVAEGWHKGSGLPHAEVEAIADAKKKNIALEECTLVVTLEPCTHQGKTPPCTDAIIEAGIKKVIIGALDPNPSASGGAELLRSRGIHVETGIAEAECLDLIDDFITWQTSTLPYTIVKLASTMDGRIASRTGHSKWVTCPDTREKVHELRQHMHAVIIGGNTFYLDDPILTCRLPLPEVTNMVQPFAVIVTSRLPDANAPYRLLTQRPESTIFWTTVAAAASPKAEKLRKLGVRVIGLAPESRDGETITLGKRSTLNLAEGFKFLRQELNCHYVLCEGGGKLGLTLLEKKLTRELHLHLAPKILGDNEATPLFDGRSPDSMTEALQLRIINAIPNSCDLLITLKPKRANDSCCNELETGAI